MLRLAKLLKEFNRDARMQNRTICPHVNSFISDAISHSKSLPLSQTDFENLSSKLQTEASVCPICSVSSANYAPLLLTNYPCNSVPCIDIDLSHSIPRPFVEFPIVLNIPQVTSDSVYLSNEAGLTSESENCLKKRPRDDDDDSFSQLKKFRPDISAQKRMGEPIDNSAKRFKCL